MKKTISIISMLLILTLALTGCYEKDGKRRSSSDNEASFLGLTDAKSQSIEIDVSHKNQVAIPENIGPFILKESDGSLYDGVAKYSGDHLAFYVVVDDAQDHSVTVTSDNTEVAYVNRVNVSPSYTDVYIYFREAGEAKLKFKSVETGETETIRVVVKESYDCDPGKKNLTPEEYAECAEDIARAYDLLDVVGAPEDTSYITLQDEDLTWENIERNMPSECRSWWGRDYRRMNCVYLRTDDEGHQFCFYLSK